MSINIGNEGSILIIYKDEQGKYKTYIKGTETQEDGEVKDIFMSKKVQFRKGVEVKNLDLKLEKGHAVCFDFDGVIHKYSKGWQDGSIYDEANPEALDLMLFLQKVGIPVFICSTRKPEQIISWWNQQGFWADAVKIGDKVTFFDNLNIIGVTNRKFPAQMYIDDRAYKYTGQTVKQFILDNSTEE